MRHDRLRSLREEKGYTQEEFAELLGETRLQIWRWENKKSIPDAETIVRLAKTLNVSSDYLLGISDDLLPSLSESDLSVKERAVVAAMRRGNTTEAIRVIVGD